MGYSRSAMAIRSRHIFSERTPTVTTLGERPGRRWFLGHGRLLAVIAAVSALALTLRASRTAHATTERENPYALLSQLGRVLTWIENEYVDPVDRRTLLEGALEG